MIYTLTLNPALDYVIQVDHFKTGIINRNKSEAIYYGGKGINVSCILNELKIENTALGFVAGFTGKALSDGLNKMGIHCDFISLKEGMTRINVKMKSDEETEINGLGPSVSNEEFAALMEKIKEIQSGDILIISGNVPKSLPSDIYEQIVKELKEGISIIVDAEKDLLSKILPYHPLLVKPNRKELASFFDAELKNDEDILFYARKLQDLGARNVLVSLGADGALLVGEKGEVCQCDAAKGRAVNTVGAGDSMVAGFLAGLLQTGDLEQSLKLGTACGGATAFHSGLASAEEIEEVLNSL